jgi:hypothetical protein
MHTRNVNVKTATEESSRKMGNSVLNLRQIISLYGFLLADEGALCHERSGRFEGIPERCLYPAKHYRRYVSSSGR